MRPRDIPVVAGFALAVMILNVLASFAVVWFYSAFVEPGHPEAFYQAFALRAAPVSSVVAGMPLMFIAGMLIARRRIPRHALIAAAAMALLYIAVDAAILLAAKVSPGVWAWELLSYSTKLIAAIAGAAVGSRGRKQGG
jgi:hypothetical protein